MLPKNNLRNFQATKLRIFPGTKHLHEDKLPPGTPTIFQEFKPFYTPPKVATPGPSAEEISAGRKA
jgi:hypothetical protein